MKKLILLIATILLAAGLVFPQNPPTASPTPKVEDKKFDPTVNLTADEARVLAEFITSLEKSGSEVDRAAAIFDAAKSKHETLLTKRQSFVYLLANKYDLDLEKIKFSDDGKTLLKIEPPKK